MLERVKTTGHIDAARARHRRAREVEHETPRQTELNGPEPAWSDSDHDAHEECGQALAVHIARELPMTGRGDVVVYAYRRTVGVVQVRAGDPVGS